MPTHSGHNDVGEASAALQQFTSPFKSHGEPVACQPEQAAAGARMQEAVIPCKRCTVLDPLHEIAALRDVVNDKPAVAPLPSPAGRGLKTAALD